jgi:hypothetical protein
VVADREAPLPALQRELLLQQIHTSRAMMQLAAEGVELLRGATTSLGHSFEERLDLLEAKSTAILDAVRGFARELRGEDEEGVQTSAGAEPGLPDLETEADTTGQEASSHGNAQADAPVHREDVHGV